MKNDYSRNISMICPTCASTEFSFDGEIPEEQRTYCCTACTKEFSYQDIIDSNSETISRGVDAMKSEIISDIKADFKNLFK